MAIRIDCVVGARPNFIKMAAILNELHRRPAFEGRLIHTGQHYSPEMSDTFFSQLRLPEPDIHLGVSGGTPTQQTAEMLPAFEKVFAEHRPDLVLVVGDVTSTVAAALVAVRSGIPVAHVEAGLRSFDREMPEEINRVVTDVLSEYLFASERSGVDNLRNEGIPAERVFLVGNVMIDTLLRFRNDAAHSTVLDELELTPGGYVVATLHRPSNVDDPEQLRTLVEILRTLSDRMPVVFPVHPRTRERLRRPESGLGRVLLTAPMSYFDFLHLLSNARVVLTDSGGIQEETTILQVPCLTIRENTERPVTITHGSNRLVGTDPPAVLKAALETLDQDRRGTFPIPDLWDGGAAGRVFDVLEAKLAG